jgi:hypothetical protein
MEIRDAVTEEASAICQVLRRSISELCVADHKNDPEILAEWLRNKTPELIASWIASSGGSYLVAIEGRTILGVGSVTDAGEITLNYVLPEARFRRGQSGDSASPRVEGYGPWQYQMRLDQHRNRPSLLPYRRLHRRWAAHYDIQYQFDLSNVQAP